MAFGNVLGTLSGSNVSVPATFSATGSVAVVQGDLIISVIAEQTSLTVSAVTDNLGNVYTAQNAGTDAGTSTGRMFYSRVSKPGTLTSVDATCTASGDDAAHAVVCFAGPFSTPPIDRNIANGASDISSPFTGPATGTLAQAVELILSWAVLANTVNPPDWVGSGSLVKRLGVSPSTVIGAVIGSYVVAATTTQTPAWTGTNPSTDDVLGVATFMQEFPFGQGIM